MGRGGSFGLFQRISSASIRSSKSMSGHTILAAFRRMRHAVDERVSAKGHRSHERRVSSVHGMAQCSTHQQKHGLTTPTQ